MRAALEQAHLARSLACDEGAVHRARWIEEEFALQEGSAQHAEQPLRAPDTTGDSDRHIQALIRMSQASTRELTPSEQSSLVLDEIIGSLRAERGYLYMRPNEPGRLSMLDSARDLRCVAARDESRRDLPEVERLPVRHLERALSAREVVFERPSAPDGEDGTLLLAPLMMQGTVVGVACLEASPSRPAFTAADGEVFRALLGQAPVTLELAQALRDRDRLSEDLRHSQKMEAIGRLAGGIAHDFNNMLAAISVASESVLADLPLDSEHRPDLDTVKAAADRATRLTRQLLAFSRRQVFDARPLALNDVINDLVPMLRRLLGERIDIEVELAGELHAIKADVAQLEQVLVNLAVNARDAMPDGGKLLLRTENCEIAAGDRVAFEAGRYVKLSVQDEGHGMDTETQRRVFEPFFTTKSKESGTGLGMAMVYGIVRQSGGYIDLWSELGTGTTFTIYLPRTEELPRTLSPPASIVVSKPAESGTILLVDDEPLVRHALGRTLRKMGFSVTIATSGREAIRLLSKRPEVDLIITDVIMPEMNGVEMIDTLATLGVRAKVLYVSGYADGVLTRRSGLGLDVEFMQKPIQNHELAEKISQMLGVPQREQPAG